MDIFEKKEGNTTTLTLKGRLDSISSNQVDKKITESLEAGLDVILDFSSLDYLSSAGIRVLVQCYKSFHKSNKHQLILVSVPKHIEHILYITGFLPYFKIYEDRASAIQMLNNPNPL